MATQVRGWLKVVVETYSQRGGNCTSHLEQPKEIGRAPLCTGCGKVWRWAKHNKSDPDPSDLQLIPIEDVSCNDVVSMLDSNLDTDVNHAEHEQGKSWSPRTSVSALFAMVLVTLCSASFLAASVEATTTTTTTTTTMTTATRMTSATMTSATMTTASMTTATATRSCNINNIYVNSGRFWAQTLPAKANQRPSIFCWIVLRVGQQHLVKYQLIRGMGIFDCNEWAVMTDVTVALNRWVSYGFPRMPAWTPDGADLASWAIGSTQAPLGPEGNALNAFAFMNAWAAIRDSNRLQWHDWVVKVDPDTVWFPPRLRVEIQNKILPYGNEKNNIFVTNCKRWNTMQGPMEVLSRSAALMMLAQQSQCGSFDHRAEDQFLVDCLRRLGIKGWMEQNF